MCEMSEAEKVRLVRCPNCQNLLTELPGYSVYQCGACSTLLTGTISLIMLNTSSLGF